MIEIPEPVRRGLAQYGITRFELAPGGLGLSGAVVFRAHGLDARYCLRRWPRGTTPARVVEVRHFMHALHEAGCDLVPKIHPIGSERCWQSREYVWDLSQWMPGRSLRTDERSISRFKQAFESLGRLHHAARTLGTWHQIPPSVIARIERIDQINESPPLASGHSVSEPIASLQHRVRNLWLTNHQAVHYQLSQFSQRPMELSWVLRDVHLDHILFDVDQGGAKDVAGIIDYDAVRVDSWVMDYSRLQRSCSVTAEAARDLEVAYRGSSERAWNPGESELIDVLDRATCLIAAANWCQWLGVEQRQFAAGPDKAIQRFQTVVSDAEKLFQAS